MNLAIERYVWRVSRRLRPHAPPERRRSIRAELRGHLRDAAAEMGTRAAVEQAGDPAAVALAYAEVEIGRPREWRPGLGAVAAAIVFLVLAVLQQREIHMHRAAHWAHFDPWGADLYLVRLSGDLERSLALHVDVARPAYVLIPLLASCAGREPGAACRSAGTGHRPRSRSPQ